jgi:hypothetical protein
MMRTTIIGGGRTVGRQHWRAIVRWLITSTLLVGSHTGTAGTIATDINLQINGLTLSKSDPGGAISGSLSSGGRNGFGFASIGTLGSKVNDIVAGNDSAQVDFVDTISFIGSGTIDLSENLTGVLQPTGSGTAKVVAAMTLSGTGVNQATSYQKLASTSGVLESDQGPLIVPVNSGQSLTLFATMTTVVIGIGVADYSATDNIFITPMTPGLQVISAAGHDYSPQAPSSTPEPGSLSVVAAGLAAWWVRKRTASRLAG